MRAAPVTTLKLVPMGEGWLGIEQAVRAMQRNVGGTLRDQRVRRVAEWVLHQARAKGGDRTQESRAFFEFTLERLEYRRDPAWLEYIQDPLALLARIEAYGWAAGDCDDHAELTASLGLQVRLPLVYVLASEPDARAWSRTELLVRFREAARLNREPPVHVYAAMREHRDAEPSREWLEGNDRAYSGLVSLDTARPGATFGRHVEGCVRYVRDAAA